MLLATKASDSRLPAHHSPEADLTPLGSWGNWADNDVTLHTHPADSFPTNMSDPAMTSSRRGPRHPGPTGAPIVRHEQRSPPDTGRQPQQPVMGDRRSRGHPTRMNGQDGDTLGDEGVLWGIPLDPEQCIKTAPQYAATSYSVSPATVEYSCAPTGDTTPQAWMRLGRSRLPQVEPLQPWAGPQYGEQLQVCETQGSPLQDAGWGALSIYAAPSTRPDVPRCPTPWLVDSIGAQSGAGRGAPVRSRNSQFSVHGVEAESPKDFSHNSMVGATSNWNLPGNRSSSSGRRTKVRFAEEVVCPDASSAAKPGGTWSRNNSVDRSTRPRATLSDFIEYPEKTVRDVPGRTPKCVRRLKSAPCLPTDVGSTDGTGLISDCSNGRLKGQHVGRATLTEYVESPEDRVSPSRTLTLARQLRHTATMPAETHGSAGAMPRQQDQADDVTRGGSRRELRHTKSAPSRQLDGRPPMAPKKAPLPGRTGRITESEHVSSPRKTPSPQSKQQRKNSNLQPTGSLPVQRKSPPKPGRKQELPTLNSSPSGHLPLSKGAGGYQLEFQGTQGVGGSTRTLRKASSAPVERERSRLSRHSSLDPWSPHVHSDSVFNHLQDA